MSDLISRHQSERIKYRLKVRYSSTIDATFTDKSIGQEDNGWLELKLYSYWKGVQSSADYRFCFYLWLGKGGYEEKPDRSGLIREEETLNNMKWRFYYRY